MISKLLENLNDPTEKDWIAVKRILRYLKGIQEVGLVFGGKKARKDLEGWVDADWAGNVKSRLSRSGYVFKIAGGAISRSSKKQGNVALSTAEVEYVSGYLGTQKAIWLRFIERLGETLNTPMLNMDNQGMIADTLTKALAKPSFKKFNQMMDLIENNDQEGVLQK